MTGIRLKSIVKIPANIVGTDGVTVDHSGGVVTIGIDPDLVPTGMEWRGNWNALTNYEDNDAVAHEGASYIATAANLNSEPPSADWDVLAQAGSGTVVVDDQITPPMLDADTAPKTLLFHSRLGTVAYDNAQSLTDAQILQARTNIYAAPFDAMAYSGMQINGSMEVSQENGSTTIDAVGALKYIVDGWIVHSNGVQHPWCLQSTNVPNLGITHSFQWYANVANAAPSATNLFAVRQAIEGWRVARLSWGSSVASPITLAFWILVHRAGTYSVAINNAAENRSYVTSITVAADVWEYKTITIPGDTTGTWLKDNGIGLRVSISFMVGTTYQTTANVWTAGTFFGVTGTTNGIAAITDYGFLTGLVVLPGTQAPTAAQSPLIMRPYDQELVTCQRYYDRRTADAVAAAFASGYCFNTTLALFSIGYLMRSTPTLSFGPSIGDMGVGISGVTPAVLSLATIGSNTTMRIGATTSANLVTGQGALLVALSTQTVLSLDARL